MPSSTRERLLLDRREFLKGCCATAAVGAVAGPSLLFSDPAHAAANPYDTIVHVFLRGGIDGLNLVPPVSGNDRAFYRSEEHTSELQSLMRISYAVFCLKKKKNQQTHNPKPT